MLQVNSTTINKEATETVEDYTYNVSVNIQDKELISISCQINKAVKTDDPMVQSQQLNYVGYMQLANGQITSQINQDEDGIIHLQAMHRFIEEVDGWIKK